MFPTNYSKIIFIIIGAILYLSLSKIIKNKDIVDILCLMISSIFLSIIITLFLIRVYYEIQRFIW